MPVYVIDILFSSLVTISINFKVFIFFSRPYLLLLRLCYSVASVCHRLSSVTFVAKWCVLEQKLLLIAYRKSYMRNQLVPKLMTLTFV